MTPTPVFQVREKNYFVLRHQHSITHILASYKYTRGGFVKEVTANFNAQSIEREVQEHWRIHDTYQSVKDRRSAGKPFFFVDGPPYTPRDHSPRDGVEQDLKRQHPALPADERQECH